MLPEPFNTLAFLILIPLLIQIFKVYRTKSGKAPSKMLIQSISLVVSALFVALSGGFAGLAWPALPAFGGDLIVMVTGILTFAVQLSSVVGLAFGAITGLYELIFKRLYDGTRLAGKAIVAAVMMVVR